MALVNIVNMIVLDNPTSFSNPFQFEITFECLQALDDDLEWKVLYVGNAEDTSQDQTLEEVLVGPVPTGTNKFVLQTNPPNAATIPEQDIVGVTVILITCSYREQEFIRVGYYVNNEYSEEYDPEVGPPKPLDISKVNRQILADKPRVTRFPIDWRTMEQQQIVTNMDEDVDGGKGIIVSEDSDGDMMETEKDDLNPLLSFSTSVEA